MERTKVLELLSALQLVLETKKNRTNQERELLMSLKTSPVYLEQIEKIKRQSRSEGLAEGLAEGRTVGERELVIKQLTRKIGNLSPELMAKVNNLNLKGLEALGEALLDFQTMADLENWLAQL